MGGHGRLLALAVTAAAAATIAAASVGAEQTARPLLPDLRAQAPRKLTFNTIGIGGATVNGCFADEIAEDGARRCLRFDQGIANFGEGPFELRYAPPDYVTDPFMYQRIYRADGSFEDRKAERYEFHATHAHFHYRGFAQSRLWRTDASGARVGSEPLRIGRKNGFCVMDIERVRRDAPSKRYDGSGCTATTEWTNGITEGWADVYDLSLPDQYIEVSGVPDGTYQLETRADPEGTVVESSESNNSVFLLIRLQGNTVKRIGKAPEPAPPAPPPAPTATATPTPAAKAPPKKSSKRPAKRRSCRSSRQRASARRSSKGSSKRKSSCRRTSSRRRSR